MLSYSPVDNIKKAAYPNMLVLAGLHDPRSVPPEDPIIWVAVGAVRCFNAPAHFRD